MTQMRRTVRPFTGKHITLILVSFFGVVVGVNVLMARLATSTFGGVVVENSYVASQHFNGWLKEASAEQALGWKGAVSRDTQGRAAIVLHDSAGKAIAAAKVTAIAEHPLGQRPQTDLVLHEVAPGTYAAPLEAGRWRLRVTVEAEGKVWRTVGDVL
ncbi:FixH family protein [Novosphingobium taihuense]|uniref:Nitrogen fixation protein FixH n=1 Tax=Novosphingobium taihuense TaxID=260085 RepID=A0A7W7A8L6_9SPHN|nr:FixH family protein [Novosphingobium taihuense]MBB4612430.1 nitrogen fixation protein FixH [Novosphingobium taihuense]TWH88218.1 nitrogen fixation protein FixH [Novosphingobium taihuense]